MSDQRSKGENLMMEAEAQLNARGGLCCRSKVRAGVDHACELYVKAANAFKMAKEWQLAGNAFSEAASLELKNERKTEAAMHYVEAAKCYKKVSPADCEACLTHASEVYDDVGRGKTAAKQHLTLAELLEEQNNLQRAVDEYQKAADMFAAEELHSSTTKCKLKVAAHSATLGDYKRAEVIYEEAGSAALENKLLKYTASENYAKAGLCRLASDPQNGKALLDKLAAWADISPAFVDSREYMFLTQLAEAASKEDVDAFNEAIRSHESVSQLSAWDHDLLKQVRRQIGPDLR